ncbi:hypothetical protein U1E44_11385 [Arenibacter sp. GZD96]|uniref:beta strand repeat-containing protein n=1 Tax=Aurantibrevibacter litoralis TaxID=3106030 RepID=UPI002AFE52B8|nr:hypothetical protein [Arenibacter sp. GZD-96]MEA1786697.1 hypothetical protein [Arenibacter sp. GZD-96]
MKAKLLLLFVGLICYTSAIGQVKIGDNPQNIDASSLLELESNTRALVITRITTAQMNAMNPLQGAVIYNTDTQCLHYFNGGAWLNLCEDLGQSRTFTANAQVNPIPTIVITENPDNLNFEVGQITGANIVDGTINGANDIQAGSVTQNNLALNSVGRDQLVDNAVTPAEIDLSVVTLNTFTNDAGFITGPVVSTDPNNAITEGTDLGAFYDDSLLQGGISTNATNIDTNTTAIAANATAITNNSSAIATNATAIATNVANITTNTTYIADNASGLALHITADGDLDANNEIQNLEQVLTQGNAANNGITNLTNPINPQDAATKFYVDSAITVATPKVVSDDVPNSIIQGTDGGALYADPDNDATNEIQTLAQVLAEGANANALILSNLADPVAAQDAATKAYVDNTLAAGSGETNTASNEGTAGVGVFVQKTGTNLEFRNINAGSNLVTITEDMVNNEIDIDVNETNLTISESQISDLNHTVDTDDQTATEVPVAATPLNYTPSDPNVESHLAAIDTALGTVGTGSTEEADGITITGSGAPGDGFKIEPSPILGQFLRTEPITGNVIWDDLPTGTGGAVMSDGSTIIGDGVATDLAVPLGGITTTQLLDGTVQTLDIADDAVTASKINPDVAGTGLIQNAITGALEIDPTAVVGNGNITSNDLIVGGDVNALLGNVTLDILDDAVTATKINPDVAGTGLIQNAITGALEIDPTAVVGNGNITSNDLIVGGDTNALLGNVTLDILDDAVTASKINPDVAGTGLIQNAITGALEIDPTAVVGNGNITSTDLIVGGDANALLGNVTLDILDDAVTTAKILDANVTEAKIAPGAADQILRTNATGTLVEWVDLPVTTGSTELADQNTIVGDGSIGNEFQVADGGITAQQIANDAITTDKILVNSVTPAKILGGNEGDFLSTNAAGDAVWTNVIPNTITGTPNSLFFANATGLPITAEDTGLPANERALFWDPAARSSSGALFVGLNPSSALSNNAKMVVAERIIGLAYPLQLVNESDAIGDAVGMLFSASTNINTTTHGKGGLVYERTLTNSRGDFHLLQNPDADTTNPELANHSVLTLKNDGNLVLGPNSRAIATNKKLHVEGTMRLTAQLFDENDESGTPGQVLSTTASGVDWIDLPAGSTPLVFDNTTLSGDGSIATPYTVADNAISEIKIQNDAVTTAKILDANVTPTKIEPSLTNGQVLTTVGGIAVWEDLPPGGAILEFDSATIAGDGSIATPYTVADDGISTTQIANATILGEDINQMSATDGQVLKWNNTSGVWEPANDFGNNFFAGNGLTLNVSTFDVNTDNATIGINGADNLEVLDGGITTQKIADDAVTTTKILDANVTPTKLEPGNSGQFLSTNLAGDVEWTAVTPGSVLGTPQSLFFADTDGTAITAEATGFPLNFRALFWNPTSRFESGALFIGLKPDSPTPNLPAEPFAKVVIAERLNNQLVFPLKLVNESNVNFNTSAGILFSTERTGTHGKGALVYERMETQGRGDFHFLQNSDNNNANPNLATSVMTIKNNGNVIIAPNSRNLTPQPPQKLYVGGDMRLTEGFFDASGNQGALGQILSSTGAGTAWINPPPAGGGGNLSDTNLSQNGDLVRTYEITNATQSLVFSGAGNVGIGNFGGANPALSSDKLDVNGQIRARQGFAANTGSVGQPSYGFHTGGDSNTGMYRPATDEIGFSVGGVEALRVDEYSMGNTQVLIQERLGIGFNLPQNSNYSGANVHSTLQVTGSFATAIFTTSGNLGLNDTHHTIILGGNHDITLPPAATFVGRIYIIKNTTGTSPTIDSYVDSLGVPTTNIPAGVIHLQSDGTNWQQIN